MRLEPHWNRPRRFPIYTLEILHIVNIMRRAIIGYVLGKPYGWGTEGGRRA